MLIGAVEDGAMDSVPIDSAGIDAAGVDAAGMLAGAIEAAMVAAIEGVVVGVVPPPAAVDGAGEVLLPPVHADTTNSPARASAPTRVDFIQGSPTLLTAGSARRLCAHLPMRRGSDRSSLDSIANALRPTNR
jgi:hypothetical protein